MTSTIKVDNIQDQDGNNIISENSNTLTIGNSNSKISGIGTVNWDTTAKTAAFTADSGRGYFVNTSSTAITVTLPASPSAGDIVSINDYNGSFETNACTVARNSSNIRGEASDFILDINNAGATFIYIDATEGWQVLAQGSDSDIQKAYIEATGGTVTTCGDCKIHTFTGPGTFTVSGVSCTAANNVVSYMVVAGGGSSAGADNGVRGGGGGAGGFREYKSPVTPYTASPLDGNPGGSEISVTAQAYPITVGAGASTPSGVPANSPSGAGDRGSNSVFSTITSTGGGGGATYCGANTRTGGSGGGGGSSPNAPERAGGAGNTPPVSPAQGKDGGAGTPYAGAPLNSSGGGGGGATVAGAAASNSCGGDGGNGATTSISGSSTTYAGGGGGGGDGGQGGAAGSGGGGAGGESSPATGNDSGNAGTANTGGGAGGASARMNPAPSNPNAPGSAGGSGIVIIRYKYQ